MPGGPAALLRAALRALLARCARSAPFFHARAAATALFGRTETRPLLRSSALLLGSAVRPLGPPALLIAAGRRCAGGRTATLLGSAPFRALRFCGLSARLGTRRGRALRRAGLLAAGFAAFRLRRFTTLFRRGAGPTFRAAALPLFRRARLLALLRRARRTRPLRLLRGARRPGSCRLPRGAARTRPLRITRSPPTSRLLVLAE